MESETQTAGYQRKLKSGEIVFFYDGSEDQISDDNPIEVVEIPVNINTIQPSQYNELGKAVCTTGTQTDPGGASQGTAASTTTSAKAYCTTGTETDLSSVGDRKTLETLLRWALSVCTTGNSCPMPVQDPQFNANVPMQSPAQKVGDSSSASQNVAIGTRSSTSGLKQQQRPVMPLRKRIRYQARNKGLRRRAPTQSLSPRLGVPIQPMNVPTISAQARPPCSEAQVKDKSLMPDIKVFVPHKIQTVSKECEPIDCDVASSVLSSQAGNTHTAESPQKKAEITVSSAIMSKYRPILPKGYPFPDPTKASVATPPPIAASQGLAFQQIPIAPGESPSTSSMHQVGTLSSPVGESSQLKNKCTVCEQSFRTLPELDAHIQTHYRNTGLKTFKCSICEKKFAFPSVLAMHIRANHKGKPVKCPVCEKLFAYPSSLKCHMRTHSGEKPYECTECHKRFTQRGNLADHMRTHTGDAPHACSYCSKRFTHQTTLKRHMRLHTGPTFKCSHCDKEYCQENGLKVHLRSKHTGERPFRCNLCDSHFTTRHILKRHMESHKGKSGIGDLPTMARK